VALKYCYKSASPEFGREWGKINSYRIALGKTVWYTVATQKVLKMLTGMNWLTTGMDDGSGIMFVGFC
jgi:hypothetical protein